MASLSEKTQAITTNEKSEIFKLIKKIQLLSKILGDEDLIRQSQDTIKGYVRDLGIELLAKIQPYAKKGVQLNKFLNMLTSQTMEFSEIDKSNFEEYLNQQDMNYRVETLVDFITNLEYPMPEAIKLSVSSVGKELTSLKKIIELEWGEDIFDVYTSPLKHLIQKSSDKHNFQYLIMNTLSAKGPYIDFKADGEPNMYVDGAAGGADISIITPNGEISVGAATMKTKGSIEALSYETDQVVRHYAIEQFVYDNISMELKNYIELVKDTNEVNRVQETASNNLLKRNLVLAEAAKTEGLNPATKRFHYALMKNIDWFNFSRGNMYYFPEIDEKTLEDTKSLDIESLIGALASSVISGVSAYSKFYVEENHIFNAMKDKLKTVITTNEVQIISHDQVNEALEVLSKKIDKNLFNYQSETDLLGAINNNEENPYNNVNYLMYKSMHKDITDTVLLRTDTSGLVLLSLAMMAERHPESIDLQNINFQNLATTNRDMIDVVENSKNKQSKWILEQINKVNDIIQDPTTPKEDLEYLDKNGLLDRYVQMAESGYIIKKSRGNNIDVAQDPLNIIPLINTDGIVTNQNNSDNKNPEVSKFEKMLKNSLKGKERKLGISGKLKNPLNIKM